LNSNWATTKIWPGLPRGGDNGEVFSTLSCRKDVKSWNWVTCLEYPRRLGRELGLETELSRNAKLYCSSRLGARELKLGDLLSLATKSWATSSDLQLSLSTSFNHNSSRWDCLPRVYKWDSPVLRDAILFEMRLCLHLASGGYQQIRRNCDRKKKDNNKEVHCKEVTRAGAAWTATGCEQTTPSGNFGKN